jgi:hypothetical protein
MSRGFQLPADGVGVNLRRKSDQMAIRKDSMIVQGASDDITGFYVREYGMPDMEVGRQ